MSDAVVEALWRYPVKSMQGQRLEELTIDAHGVSGDRRYALRVPSGKLGSGKQSARFHRLEGLLDLRAWYSDGRPVVALPSGRVVGGDDPAIDGLLSAALGQDVAFVHDAADPFVDVAPVHLVTTASLDWLRSRLPATGVDERRFRPNILVRVPAVATVEDGWIGRTVRVGEVELDIVDGTERCAMTNLSQPGLEHEPAVLRTIATSNQRCLGVYAKVIRGGVVRRGDPVTVG